MDKTAVLVGYLVIGAASLGVIALASTLISATFLKVLDARYDDAKRAAMLEMSGRLFQDAYWFSEDLPMFHALQKIATGISTHGWFDVSSVRDEWEREKATQDREAAR